MAQKLKQTAQKIQQRALEKQLRTMQPQTLEDLFQKLQQIITVAQPMLKAEKTEVKIVNNLMLKGDPKPWKAILIREEMKK